MFFSLFVEQSVKGFFKTPKSKGIHYKFDHLFLFNPYLDIYGIGNGEREDCALEV